MKSNYKKLGNYIREVDKRNVDGTLGEDNLFGISVSKDFIITHANLVGVTFESYKIVEPRQFAYIPDTSRRGDKIAISLNSFEDRIIVSSICSVFEIIDENELLPEYLMLWFMRPEFDRYARFMSNGSAREVFDWECMCGVEIPVPSIDEQRKTVHAYQVIKDRIALLGKINDCIETTASTLFQKMFLTSCENDLWPMGSFSHFIVSSVGGDWGQEVPIGNYTQEVSCIRGTDIPSLNAGNISTAPTRYILPKNFSSKRIKANDLVVEISGGSPVQATGRIALVPQQVLDYRGDNLICSNFCRVITVNETYLQYFLQYWLYLYKAGKMFDYENSSTGLKNFDLSAFITMEPIPIPPESVVREYNKSVLPLYKQLFFNGFEMNNLQDTLNHLLPKMMLHAN